MILIFSLGLDILANDSNAPDQDGTEIISLVSFSQPTHGELNSTFGSLIYTPSTSFIGVDSFNYTISDGSKLKVMVLLKLLFPCSFSSKLRF